jgi:hypothetical protein
MPAEQSQNVEHLIDMTCRDALVPHRKAYDVLTTAARLRAIDNLRTFHELREKAGFSVPKDFDQSLVDGISSHQGGFALNGDGIDLYYKIFRGMLFKNMIRNAVMDMQQKLDTLNMQHPYTPQSNYEMAQKNIYWPRMNIFSDAFCLLKPQFSVDAGPRLLTQVLHEQAVKPYQVGQMVDYTDTFLLTPKRPHLNLFFDREGRKQFQAIYTASLSQPDRLQFLHGLNGPAARRDIMIYGAGQN